MKVRGANPDDLPAISEIYDHEVLHSTATFDTEGMTADERGLWLSSRNESRHPVLVCESEDVIVGWGELKPWSSRKAYDRTAEVSVYVHHQHRRQGVGRLLLSELITHAQGVGIGVLVARISLAEGPASVGLHRSLGFEEVGVMHEVGEKFGRLLDIALLQRPLR